MEKIILNATKRSITGKKVGALRRQGKLPGIVYGHGIEPMPISVDMKEGSRILGQVSSSRILTLNIDGTEYSTLVREKQRDTVKGRFLHIDFQAVSETEKITAMVAIEVTGTSPAVKLFNGLVEIESSEIEVECYPRDLLESIVVDISSLAKIGDSIHVRDLNLPKEIEIKEDPDKLILTVTSVVGEEEGEKVAEEGGAAEPEVIEKGKKEEEEE